MGTHLVRDLRTWFEEVREATRQVLVNELTLPPHVELEINALDVEIRDSGSRWATETTTVTRAQLGGRRPPDGAWVRIRSLVRPGGRQLAERLIDRFGEDSYVWGMHPPAGDRLAPDGARVGRASFEEDPVSWAEYMLVDGAGLAYLKGLDSLDTSDESAANAIAEELVAFCTSDVVEEIIELPLFGLRLDVERVEVGNVTVRRLSPVESAVIAAPHAQFLTETPGTQLSRSFVNEFSLPSTHALTVRHDLPKDRWQHERGTGLPQRVFLGLQLLGLELATPAGGQTWYSPTWITSIRTGMPPPGPERRPNRLALHDLTEQELVEAVQLAAAMDAAGNDYKPGARPSTPLEAALHRMALGLGRPESTDQIIDLSVVLESLLLPESVRQGLRFRMRINGARYLEGETGELDRRGIWDQLGEIYDTRSRLVHQSRALPDHRDLERIARAAHEMASAGVRKALREGWPTPQELRDLALGLHHWDMDGDG